ncbi:UDP-glycosyltransferase 85C1-like protein [Tanacetum coccineum]
MRVNIPKFDGDTLNLEGFIDWLVAVKEVFEFKEVRVSLIATKLHGRASAWWQQLKLTRERELETQESPETYDQLVFHYIGGLRVQITDSVNMFDPVTVSDAYQRALAFKKQSRWVGSSSSPTITRGGSSSSNVASHFVPNQAKLGGGSGLKCFNCGETGHRQSECYKAGKKTLFVEPEEWEDDGVANDDYKEATVFDDDQYEEEVVTGDVGVNLIVRRSCLTPQAVGHDWLKHNIFRSTSTIFGKVCIFVVDPGSCDNLIAEEAVQKLGLKTENRPKHYKLQWLKKDTYHLLLGRPWEYDRNTAHNGRADTYSFLFGGVKITLMPNIPKELVNKPTGTLLTLSQFKDELEMGDEVHKVVHDNLVRGNSKYKQDADQVDFEVGDFMWAVLTKHRFPIGEYNKLLTKRIGSLEIIEKIDSNAYRLKLPSHIRCSNVYNVKHLLPYHGDSSNDDLVVNSRANFAYPRGNDAGPSVEEQALLFMVAQDPGIRAEVLDKMPPRRNRPLTKAYEPKIEQRVMARMKERLNHFVDQLADQMNDMMNPRRRKDRNNQGSEGEESENQFFDGDGSSSNEQLDRPRRNHKEDNRRWQLGMRVNILEFDRDTLNPGGFIDWLVAVEEVFEFKEVPENKRVSLIATKSHQLDEDEDVNEDQLYSSYLPTVNVPAVTESETRDQIC